MLIVILPVVPFFARFSSVLNGLCTRSLLMRFIFKKSNPLSEDFFPKDSYLGVLRLFLWVLEVARIRRLGSVGEVSAPAEENRDLRLFLGKNVLEPILESKVVPKRR